MGSVAVTGSELGQIRDGVNALLGLTTAQTFVTAVLMLFIVGLITAGILVSRWYR